MGRVADSVAVTIYPPPLKGNKSQGLLVYSFFFPNVSVGWDIVQIQEKKLWS